MLSNISFFFFQAEDGIRDIGVTGVQTCALPISDTAKEKPQEGEIIAAGPGARDETGKLTPLDVKAGDRVLFGKWSGTEVRIDGEDLLIMKESDIMGVIEQSASKRKAA